MSKNRWKTVRLFVVSLLNETKLQREYLFKHIFPELEQWCEKWKLHFIDIDLARKIHSKGEDFFERLNCHPQDMIICLFLLGKDCDEVVGFREINIANPKNIENFLDRLEQVSYASFCFDEMIGDKDLQELTYLQGNIEKYYFCKGTLGKEKVFTYSLNKQNLSQEHLLSFGNHIEQTLKNTIGKFFQTRISDLWGQSPFIEEYELHKSLIELHTKTLPPLSRSNELRFLSKYIEGPEKAVLPVYGPSNIGKTSLLAQFCKQKYFCNNPTKYCLIFRFIEAYPYKIDTTKLLQSICLELKINYNYSEEIPEKLDELVAVFKKFLMGVKKRTIIVIDGIELLDKKGTSFELYWLPNLPQWVKIIISSSNENIYKILLKKNNFGLDVKPLSKQDVKEFVEHISPMLGQKFEPQHIEILKEKQESHFPLYLQLFFQECKMTETAAQLEKKLKNFPQKVEVFFEYFLQQMEEEFFKEPQLIEMLFGLLCCSDNGLTKKELQELLLEVDENEVHLKILNLARNYIRYRENAWTFSQQKFCQVVVNKYGKIRMKQWHQYLALYFSQQPLRSNKRKLSALFYHQLHGNMWKHAVTTLCNIDYLEEKIKAGMLLDLQEEFRTALKILSRSFCVEISSDVYINQQILKTLAITIEKLLGNVLKAEKTLLQEHPECLFQTLWNYGYWHDAPQKEHSFSQKLGSKLYHLMEHWRACKEKEGYHWLKALQPFPSHLESPVLKILYSSKDTVYSINYSHDGKKIVSALKSGTIHIWDTASGECIHKLSRSKKIATSVCFSPDGTKIVSGSWDHMVRLWDAVTGELIDILSGHVKVVSSVCFSFDGTKIASGSWDGVVRIWDVATRNLLLETNKTSDWITSVCFSPDGTQIAAACNDKKVHIWEIKRGEKVFEFAEHKGAVNCVRYSHDGNKIVSASSDKTIIIWNKKGKKLHTLEGHKNKVYSVAFSPDSKKLASGSADSTLRIWDVETSNCLYSHTAQGDILSIDFDPSGDKIVIGIDDQIQIWDWCKKTSLKKDIGHEKGIARIDFVPDYKKVFCESNNEELCVWDIASGQQLLSLPLHYCDYRHSDNKQAMYSFSKDGQKIAMATSEKTIEIWELKSGKCLQVLSGHRGTISCLNFSMDNQKIVSRSWDRTLRVWNALNGKTLRVLDESSYVYDANFTPDSSKIISFSREMVKIWDIETGDCLDIINRDYHSAKELKNYNCPYQVSAQEEKTVVLKDKTPLFFFPGILKDAKISPNNILIGYMEKHIYILELCGLK